MDELGSGLDCVTWGDPHGAPEETTSTFAPPGRHGDGVPLILAPPLALDGRSFAPLAPLGEARRVVFWNLPNRLPREGGTEALGRLLLEHVDRAGLGDRIVVGGASLGGLVALAAALHAPERVAGLVLVSTSASWAELGPLLRWARLLHPFLPRRTYHKRLARLLIPNGNGPLNAALRAQMEHRTKAHVSSLIELVCGYDLRERLPEIRVPTLVIHTTRDRVAPIRAADTLARIAGAEVAHLDSSTHLPAIGLAEECLAALRPFLARIDAGATA